jgi:hypothetical protein
MPRKMDAAVKQTTLRIKTQIFARRRSVAVGTEFLFEEK